MTDTKREAPASPEKRAAALEIVLRRKADMPKNFVAEFTEHADDAWITANGAQMVARAWTDPEYRARMLVDGTSAARDPEHHRNLVVLENTATVHNVIVCTLCSCTAIQSSGRRRIGTKTWTIGRGSFASHARCCARWDSTYQRLLRSDVGYDGRYSLHGLADAAARDDWLARAKVGNNRHARLDDWCYVPRTGERLRSWTACTT